MTTTNKSEKYWQVTRRITGILMAIKTGLLFNACIFFGMFALFMGGLAFLGGGGAASDEKITQTWQLIFLMAIAPFLWPVMLLAASVNIFRRKRPRLIIVVCILSIIIELGLVIAIYGATVNESVPHRENLHMLYFLLSGSILVQAMGIVVALQVKRSLRTTGW